MQNFNTALARGGEEPKAGKTLRADMLSIALDLRSATNYTAYAGKGIINNNSLIKGDSLDALRAPEASNVTNKDLAKTFSAIKQLPCQDLGSAQLSGGSFEPGVYCASSAALAGGLTLDAKGNQNGVFVFRISGALTTKSGLDINLANGADAGNVFFVADEAVLGSGTNFKGNLLTTKNAEINAGSKVSGRVISLEGTVTATEASLGAGDGILQICKEVPEGEILEGTGNLSNRIFRFRIGANIYEVPVGGCSGPITLPTGNVVIEELLDGRFTNQPGTWVNRFRLIDVESSVPGSLGAVNLPLRTANVFIREGDISNQTVVTFTNTFAITAIIEICKRSVTGDPDVTGFFDFTVDAIANTVFSVPVGQCSGPIQVNVPTAPGPVPQDAVVRVTELAEAGFQLESGSTFPANRFLALNFNQGVRNTTACSTIGDGPVVPAECLFTNNGGGFITGVVVEGGTANQTTFNFFNRSLPGRVKVCKIAGPGIPEGTRFRFRVQGTGPSNQFPFPQLPGVAIDTTVDVVAGPASQGGFCNFVDARFIIGTVVTITELLPPLDPVPGVPPGEIRVSRIRVSVGPAVANYATRSVSMIARREVIEAEFTNFVFRPTLLKICKIAGPGVAVGTPFTFSIRIDNENGLFDPPATIAVPNVTVQAGPASQGGFCVFAQGPYTPTATTPPVGTFRVGSRVYVTEAAAPGTTITAITSPTGTPIPCVPADARCAGLVLGFPDGFNEITFTNAQSTPGTGAARAPFDFDGDNKSDISVYRNGTWIWTKSSNGQTSVVNFGLPSDLTVPADFDGDQKADIAVYREGTWHILQSSNGQYRGEQFGAIGDIPQAGDFDGDGKADLGVFRPSTGSWYMLQSRDGFTGMQFGMSTDKPVAGDYDGDGRTDVAVYRSGTWYMMRSRDGFTGTQFGLASDLVVPADYDGDGKTDVAVFRSGTWYMQRSTAGFTGMQFGMATDKPVPGDYNGDGKADVAVYRDGTWHMMLSGNAESSYSSMVLGGGADLPIPNSSVR